MRKKTHGRNSESISLSQAAFEAGVKFGEFYSALEAHIDAFRKSEGSAFSLHEIRTRVDQLLEAKEIREGLLNPQLVPQMRHVGAGADQGGESGLRAYEQPSNSHFHVQPRDRQTLGRRLSKKARKAISDAQRARWAKQRAKTKSWPDVKTILALREEGKTLPEIAAELKCSVSVISRALTAEKRRTGRPIANPNVWSAERRREWSELQRKRMLNPRYRKAMLKRMEKMRAAKDKKQE